MGIWFQKLFCFESLMNFFVDQINIPRRSLEQPKKDAIRSSSHASLETIAVNQLINPIPLIKAIIVPSRSTSKTDLAFVISTAETAPNRPLASPSFVDSQRRKWTSLTEIYWWLPKVDINFPLRRLTRYNRVWWTARASDAMENYWSIYSGRSEAKWELKAS